MNDLFVYTLRDVYYAENHISQALPEMIKQASDPRLKEALTSHFGETENQIARLEEVFRLQGLDVKGANCPAINGIIDESAEITGEVASKDVRDAALIAAAQTVEHYEMTRYGSLVAWANQLGRGDCASILQRTLEEEKAADKKLTMIAESTVNPRASHVPAR